MANSFTWLVHDLKIELEYLTNLYEDPVLVIVQRQTGVNEFGIECFPPILEPGLEAFESQLQTWIRHLVEGCILKRECCGTFVSNMLHFRPGCELAVRLTSARRAFQKVDASTNKRRVSEHTRPSKGESHASNVGQ